MPACQARLPDGRLHFQHGPIDIVIGADGEAQAVAAAHAAAWRRFESVLDELVAELPLLREPIAGPCRLTGPIARRMWLACEPYREGYITPMAAVAGAVAQELIAFYEQGGIERAWVNDGGDIAWHLAPRRSLRVGLFADLSRLDAQQIVHGIRSDGQFDVTHELPVRGVATSGWRGRSFSRGIADSVTVLARTAAEADAAATVIANAVDVTDSRIVRKPACEVKDDSDLGAIAVTVDVPPLGAEVTRRALAAGARRAAGLRDAGLIWSCTLVCQGQVTYVGAMQAERAADANSTLVHTAVAA
ncbi:MAG TPA: UPF0280 family protein [Burkholderiaceae bacterium]|nr:UPF0280 family protein [Burkholderiaceae bacterium]